MKESFPQKEIVYSSPKQNFEQENDGVHKFEIKEGGKVIGGVEMLYSSKPLPMYILRDLWIDIDEQGKGYSNRIMENVEKFLMDRHKSGILVEAIIDENKKNIYQKRGWEIVNVLDGGFTYVFNWPKTIDQKVLIGWYNQHTDPIIRGK